MTSSTRARVDGRRVRPSASAVLRLTDAADEPRRIVAHAPSRVHYICPLQSARFLPKSISNVSQQRELVAVELRLKLNASRLGRNGIKPVGREGRLSDLLSTRGWPQPMAATGHEDPFPRPG